MDIDIDVADRTQLLELIKHIPAAIHRSDGTVVKHNTGVYLQWVPYDPHTNMCSQDHREVNAGFKLDILNVHLYKQITSEQHLDQLLAQEPMWELLEHKEIVEQLVHLNGNYDVVRVLKPKSIEQLAACLAIIRPSKRYLLHKDWDTILREVWQAPADGSYAFKRAHGIAYSHLVVVNLNLLTNGV